MIRVHVPIDVGTVTATASSAFALATPIRVDRLIALAVGQSCGERAPEEKRARHVRATLEGFRACSGIVVALFFAACTALLAVYRINKAMTHQIADELAERRRRLATA